MSDTIRYAFVGAGGYARGVNRTLQELGKTELVAACDPNADQRAQMIGDSKAGSYDDFEQMLNENEIDALFVCVPPFAHFGQEITAAKKGIHLYVAKPIALDYEYAKQVNDAITAANVISSVSYEMRYTDAVKKSKELLADNPIGLAEGMVRIRTGKGRMWFAKKKLSRGQLFTQACHIYDLFRHLIGEVKEIHAFKAEGFVPRSDDYDIEDACILVLKFHSGAIGQVNCTILGPKAQGVDMAYRVTAKDLCLSYSYKDHLLKIMDHEETSIFGRGLEAARHQEHALLSTFITAIRTGDRTPILSPYSDALKSLQLAVCADESMQSGKPISFSTNGELINKK